MSGNRDLWAALVWAVAALLVVALTDSIPLRLVISLPVLFFLTGHSILRAIGYLAASVVEHAVYAVGASIAVCLAGGLILNLMHCLTPVGWAVWCVTAIGSAAVAAWHRQGGLAPWKAAWPRLGRWHAAGFAVAAVATSGAYLVAVHADANQTQFKYTEFWMVPDAKGSSSGLVLGIQSAEASPERFGVRVTLDGSLLAVWRYLEIDPGRTWTRKIAVTAGRGHKAEATLYRADDAIIYRRVSAIVP